MICIEFQDSWNCMVKPDTKLAPKPTKQRETTQNFCPGYWFFHWPLEVLLHTEMLKIVLVRWLSEQRCFLPRPGDLSSIPEVLVVGEENLLPNCSLTSTHEPWKHPLPQMLFKVMLSVLIGFLSLGRTIDGALEYLCCVGSICNE